MNITQQMIAPSAQAGIELLQLRTTLVPGDLKDQIAVLQAVLMSIATGSLIVVPPPQPDVELPDKAPQGEGEPTKEPDNAKLRKAVASAIEEGRESTGPELPETDAGVQSPDGADRSDRGAGSAAKS